MNLRNIPTLPIALALLTLLFACKPEEKPKITTITKFTPTRGYEGDVITIEGTNFAPNVTSNQVKFNGTEAVINLATTSFLLVVVPVNATSGKIEVTTNIQTILSTEDFSVISAAPVITEIQPLSGATGSTVNIKGNYFTSDISAISVKFNNVSANVVSATPTSLQVTVPDDAVTGKVSVAIRGILAMGPQPFTIDPKITDVMPKEGRWGGLVTINGSGFNETTTINFSGYYSGLLPVASSIVSITNRQMVVVVPPTAGTGKLYLGNNSTSFNFTVLPSWVKKKDFPMTYSPNVSFAINEKAYFGIERDNSTGKSFRNFYEYDPQNDSWTKKADFPGVALDGVVSFSIGGKGYVGLGYNSLELWEYDPALDVWTMASTFPGEIRNNPTWFVLNENVYILGGAKQGSQNGLNDVWEYTPATNIWVRKTDFPGGVFIGNIGMAINGMGYSSHLVNWNDNTFYTYQYSPSSDSWSKKSDIPIHVGPDNIVPLKVFGGEVPWMSFNNIGYVFYDRQHFEYLPAYDKWFMLRKYEQIDAPLETTSITTGVTIGGKGYFVTIYSTLYEFTPPN